jgi:UDP-N-acetylmuramoyl-tripeptide--D-alanyl-D-alanine ligase
MGADVTDVSAELFDKEIDDFSIDSRSVRPGEVFFALSQEDYVRAGFNGTFADGHQFIPAALGAGALAVVARADHLPNVELHPFRDRLVVVEDAIAALQLLAHRVYEAWARPVIGITGSAGKTTAKELTAHVLSKCGWRVLKSQRNYNNNLGLPLAVLQMVSLGRAPEEFDVAVLEMGMSTPTHEIQRLCQITPPLVGVELNVAPVHLEYLGTIENVAAAKAELIEGLKPGGTAVLNADDEWVIKMRDLHQGPAITFGIDHEADVNASEIDASRLGLIRFRLQTPLGEVQSELHMSGRHNLMNALAAAAVATYFEIAPAAIGAALSTAAPPKMRGEVLEFVEGFTVIDDSYNSNPRSLMSMVRTVADLGNETGRRIVIAGEMLELGSEARQLHREAGREIAASGIDVLWGVRDLARDILAGANEAGLTATRFFDSSEEAAKAIVDEVKGKDLVLVKGSRGVATDKIVNALRAHFALRERAEEK